MKPYERRAAKQPYYKLATYDPRSFVFRDGKVAYDTEQEARDAATKQGRYRISVVSPDGKRTDMQPFTVTGMNLGVCPYCGCAVMTGQYTANGLLPVEKDSGCEFCNPTKEGAAV